MGDATIDQCHDIGPFLTSIVQQLNTVSYSGAGLYLCNHEGHRFFAKICLYKKSGHEYYRRAAEGGTKEVEHQVSAEILILQELKRELIAKGITPGIIEIIAFSTCTDINKLIKRSNLSCPLMIDRAVSKFHSAQADLCRYAEHVSRGIARDAYAFIFLERCDVSVNDVLVSGLGPLDYMRRDILWYILFCVIHTLTVITDVFPGFRHYDLHTGNVMLIAAVLPQTIDARRLYLRFERGDKVWNVPFPGFYVKIIDFGFSKLPSKKIFSDFEADPFHPAKKLCSDISWFLRDMYRTIHESPAVGSGFLNLINELFDVLDPAGIRYTDSLDKTEELEKISPTLAERLESSIFHTYTSPVKDKYIYRRFVSPQTKAQ